MIEYLAQLITDLFLKIKPTLQVGKSFKINMNPIRHKHFPVFIYSLLIVICLYAIFFVGSYLDFGSIRWYHIPTIIILVVVGIININLIDKHFNRY